LKECFKARRGRGNTHHEFDRSTAFCAACVPLELLYDKNICGKKADKNESNDNGCRVEHFFCSALGVLDCSATTKCGSKAGSFALHENDSY